MLQQPSTRLALSYTSPLYCFVTQKCLSPSPPQCFYCCLCTDTTRSTILTMPNADLTLQTSEAHSPVWFRHNVAPGDYRVKRQKTPTNLHRSTHTKKTRDQKTPNNSRPLQRNGQITKARQDRQTKVSSLTLPRSVRQHHLPKNTSPPAHRPTPNSPNTNAKKTLSNTNNIGKSRNSKLRHAHQQPKCPTAARLLRSHNHNRTLNRHIARRNQIATKPHPRQQLNTQHKNLPGSASRHWNPNRNTAMPSPTTIDDRKHRMGEIQQYIRQPQPTSSNHHCYLLCSQTHLSSLCPPLLRPCPAPCCRKQRRCNYIPTANTLRTEDEADSSHRGAAHLQISAPGHTLIAADYSTVDRHQRRSSPPRQHQRPKVTTNSSQHKQTPSGDNDNCRNQLEYSTTQDRDRHLKTDDYWHQSTISNTFNKRHQLPRRLDRLAQLRTRRADTYRSPNKTRKGTLPNRVCSTGNRRNLVTTYNPCLVADNSPTTQQSKPPNSEGTNTSKQTRLYACKTAEELGSSGTNGKQPNTNGLIVNFTFTAATPVTRSPHQYQIIPGPSRNHPHSKLNALLPHSPVLLQQSHSANHSRKYPPNLSFLKHTLPYNWHKIFYTLSYASNPNNAWETYASRRAPACTSKALVPHAKFLRKTKPHEHQLLNSSHTLNTSFQSYHILIYLIHLCLQLSSRTMTGNAKPNTRHHSTNNANDVAMEEVTPLANELLQTQSKQLRRNPRTSAPRYPSTEIHPKWSSGMDIQPWKSSHMRRAYHLSPPPHQLMSYSHWDTLQAKRPNSDRQACHFQGSNKNFGLPLARTASRANISTLPNYLMISR